MSVLQTTYDRRHTAWREGDVASEYGPPQTDSYQVVGTDGIDYGRAVMLDAGGGKRCAVGIGADGATLYATDFLGITRTDRQRVQGKYSEGEMAGVLSNGDIAVRVTGAVSIGDEPIIVLADGTFSHEAPVGTLGAVDVIDGGAGYTSDPTIRFAGGGQTTDPVVTITRTSNVITGITVTTAGAGFTAVPEVQVTGGGGSGAVLRARLTLVRALIRGRVIYGTSGAGLAVVRLFSSEVE